MKPLLLLLVGTGLLLGCQKDDLLYVTNISASSLKDVLLPSAPPLQTFSFILSQPQSLRTAAGATLSFPANAFMLPNGTLATGKADLRVRESYTVADMVLSNTPTTALNGVHLISGGEFNIQVWQGTSRLRLAPVSATGVLQRLALTSPVPTAGLDTTRMLLWKLRGQAFGSTSPDSSVWLPVYDGQPGTSRQAAVQSTGSLYSASLPLDSIGGWNIDQFWHAYTNHSTSLAYVDVPAGASETRVYFRPVGYNGLARCALTATPTRWASSLPNGADVIAVVLQMRDQQLYYGTQRITTQAGTIIAPPLQALSAADIVQRIRQL